MEEISSEKGLEVQKLSLFSDNERFGRLLEAAGQMFWEIRADYTVTYANKLLRDVFGDPVGKKCHEFMANDKKICPGCPVKQVFLGFERAVSERVRTDKDGKAVWLQHTAIPIKDETGMVIAASEMIVDTTERKMMEGWLRDSERLYRNLVEQVPDIIFSLDSNGNFTFVNTQVEDFLGLSVSDVLETSLRDYVAPEHKTIVDTILNLKREEIWDEEVGILDYRGEKKYARIRCKASFDGVDAATGYEGVMRDRTSRRKLEEELRASKAALVEKIRIIDELYEHILQSGKCKAIQEHTAEVAHELRQPLAIIGGFARRMDRQLSAQKLDFDKHKQYANVIVTEISRLEKILNRLVDFTAKSEVRLENVNPNELIEYIVNITEARAREKGVKIDMNLGGETGDIPLDPGRFQQLVLNLVCNAIEASPYDGVISVDTGVSLPSEKAQVSGNLEAEGYFEMKIHNYGPKIPQEALQKIFNPFFTTKEHGTGLGLTVTKKIVEDHSGSVSVKSAEDGTTFTVWFPLTRTNGDNTGLCMADSG